MLLGRGYKFRYVYNVLIVLCIQFDTGIEHRQLGEDVERRLETWKATEYCNRQSDKYRQITNNNLVVPRKGRTLRQQMVARTLEATNKKEKIKYGPLGLGDTNPMTKLSKNETK